VIRSLVLATILVGSSVCVADPLNPSFETTYMGTPWPRPLPSYWGHMDHPSFNSYCTDVWSTDGAQSAAMFNRIGKTVAPGNYQSFNQYVDLTGVGSIEFDVCLTARPEGTFAHFEASFRVDGVPLWSSRTHGVHRDQRVDVSKLAGWHRLEIRSTAVEAGTFMTAYWTEWDNLRMVQGATELEAQITLDPGTLNLGSDGTWVTCYIELGENGDVSAIDGATVTLNGVPAFLGQQGWATAQANAANVDDFDGDGVLERMVKFDRAAVAAILRAPQTTVTVEGKLSETGVLTEMSQLTYGSAVTDGPPFKGAATLHVLDRAGPPK
jgi:hypothetical protein